MVAAYFSVGALSLVLMCLATGVVSGQDYPNKPIRVLTSEIGGGNDFLARLLAQRASASLGQQIIVENRGGVLPGEILSKATPDGYTLLLHGGPLWTTPLLQKTPYDPVRDFSPITSVGRTPNILVVHPGVAAKSVRELIALAKAKPGELNYAASTGASAHLAAELFNVMAGVHIVRIPYKGSGPAMIDLIAGQVQLMFATTASVAPHVKSGKLTALAVTSANPSALAPGLPTVAASGLPGYESGNIVGMFAPRGTSQPIINRLNLEIVRVLNQADVNGRFLNSGVEAAGSSPEQFAATLKSEIVRLAKLINDAHIRAD